MYTALFRYRYILMYTALFRYRYILMYTALFRYPVRDCRICNKNYFVLLSSGLAPHILFTHSLKRNNIRNVRLSALTAMLVNMPVF